MYGPINVKFAQHVPSMKTLIIQFMHPARNVPLSLSSKHSLHFVLQFAKLVFFS